MLQPNLQWCDDVLTRCVPDRRTPIWWCQLLRFRLDVFKQDAFHLDAAIGVHKFYTSTTKWSYTARYAVRWTDQSALHFTPWQTCSFSHAAITVRKLFPIPGTHFYSWAEWTEGLRTERKCTSFENWNSNQLDSNSGSIDGSKYTDNAKSPTLKQFYHTSLDYQPINPSPPPPPPINHSLCIVHVLTRSGLQQPMTKQRASIPSAGK